MTRTSTAAGLSFDPPGPGTWEQDPVHFPRPLTRYWQETHPPAFKKGTNDFARFYGLLIDGLQSAYVNGFAYNQVVPAPEAEIPNRFDRAEQVFTQKLWREQLRDWDEVQKPAAIAKHRELQAIIPDSLSDTELVAYLRRCREHHSAMISQHMRFTAGALLPTGDFLAHVGEWTGLPHSELLGLMRGSAEVSSGGSDEMVQLKRAFAQNPEAHKALASSDDPAQVLVKLRSLGGEAGAALSRYLDLIGNRLIDGFDIAEPTALEMPETLLRAIRSAVSAEAQPVSVEAQVAAVRSKVPASHQAQFDELLGEARLTYRLRDERGVYSDIWASGLMRRAALSAGRRVASRGKIASPQQMIEATLDEMCALVAGQDSPSADELAKRAEYRTTHNAKEAPPHLGPPKPPGPDLAALPPVVGRLMRAIFIPLGHLFGSSAAQNEQSVLYGLAASKGVYEGVARRIAGPSEFGRITKGDVLITASTTEAFNILLPLLGGIVTDNGGLLSHAAIVAREYGIPGVVGTREATERIVDGARVRVDGDAGEVTVLG
ncbi:MAG TPA: PEP-utilizing enzyme [Candidatus Dormibacteraeota bacterium]|nr:PEP-utilizing enzyme [Candidatus Dormibacteraeota bacterium]